MANPSALTIAFLDKRPSTAAQTLAEMEPADAGAFLDAVPSRYVVRTLTHMNSWSASRLIKMMQAPNAAAVLRDLDYTISAAVLRLVGEDERANLLALLPRKLRGDLESSLSFPDDTVGARMTTAILSLASDETVATATALLKKSSGDYPEFVILVDEEKRLVGAVSPVSLLKSAAATRLSDIADDNIISLSARARINSIARLSAWEDYSHLPVVSRKKQVIGALSRTSARAYERPQAAALESTSTSILAAVAGAFYDCAIGMGRLVADVDQPERKTKKQGAQS